MLAKKRQSRKAKLPPQPDEVTRYIEGYHQKFLLPPRRRCEQFIGLNQTRPPREKAENWLYFLVEEVSRAFSANGHIDFRACEAFTFLASRGLIEDYHRQCLHDMWKSQEKVTLDGCSHEFKSQLKATVPSPSNLPQHVLMNFWFNESDDFITDSSMMRGAVWCELFGFDTWWKRVLNYFKEWVYGGEFAEFGKFGCFNLARCDVSGLDVVNVLELALETCLLPKGFFNELHPWHIQPATPIKEYLQYAPFRISPLDCASLIFSALRINSNQWNSNLAKHAWTDIQSTFNADGFWSDIYYPPLIVTAVVLHALAVWQPPGWKKSADKAIDWIWSQQHEGGWWDVDYPVHPAYTTTLVLDSLDLVAGHRPVTIRNDLNSRCLTTTSTRITQQHVGKRSFDELKVGEAIAFIQSNSPENVKKIANHIDVKEPTFHSNYMPELKRRGVAKINGKYVYRGPIKQSNEKTS